jgi:Flp pilus assembly protein TadG
MITVFATLAALALLLMVGLVVDGAGRLRAAGRADRVAGEAARAAVEAVDTRGQTLMVDRPAAVRAARAYLAAAGVDGAVTLNGERTVEVVTTVHGRYLILGLLAGGEQYAMTGRARAAISVGVTSGDGP